MKLKMSLIAATNATEINDLAKYNSSKSFEIDIDKIIWCSFSNSNFYERHGILDLRRRWRDSMRVGKRV
jgi:hypothetical protein